MQVGVHFWSAVALERSGERRGRRWKRAPSPSAQIFLFGRHRNFQRGGERFPGKSRSGTSKVTTLALATRSLWAMAGDSRPANNGFFPRPLPVIGVRHVIMQRRAHDDDRAAPAVAPGPEIPTASAFQLPTPER